MCLCILKLLKLINCIFLFLVSEFWIDLNIVFIVELVFFLVKLVCFVIVLIKLVLFIMNLFFEVL